MAIEDIVGVARLIPITVIGLLLDALIIRNLRTKNPFIVFIISVTIMVLYFVVVNGISGSAFFGR